jgi:hypothetical protein
MWPDGHGRVQVLTYLFAILGCWIISAEIKQLMQGMEMMTPEEANWYTNIAIENGHRKT